MKSTPEERYARKTLVAELMAKASRPFDGPTVVAAVEFRRDQYGLNESQMAQVLGLPRSHYCEFVAGRRGLSHQAMMRAFVVGVPAECLFQKDAQ